MFGSYFYWISTALLCSLYLSSAVTYLVKRDWVRQALCDLGYPVYLLGVLTAVKLLAVLVILWRPDAFLSDLAYAGMLFHLLVSAMAHVGVRKPQGAVPALIGLVLLVGSFATQNAVRDLPSPYGDVSPVQVSTLNCSQVSHVQT